MPARQGSRWLRLLRHRWLDESDVHRALDAAAMARLTAKVTASEARHTGEIRLAVEAGLPLSYLWKGLTARDRAVTLFGKLRVWDTEHNNGVLIYLLLADHAIEIVADRGIARLVDSTEWQAVVSSMQQAFRAGRFEAGLEQALSAVEGVLVSRYPATPGEQRLNELPDTPWTA